LSIELELDLSFTGNLADKHRIDLYDAAHALLGFQRSLALTTHLVLNGEVITKAPFLNGAEILALPSEENGWRQKVLIAVGTALGAAAIAPKDSLLGHFVYSAYDYVISETLGFHANYEKSLGEQYRQLQESQRGSAMPHVEQHSFDLLIEKCESAIQEMHRPIVGRHTAEVATVSASIRGQNVVVGKPFTKSSFEYVAATIIGKKPEKIAGTVSSYNLDTYKGRIFTTEEHRAVPFDVREAARDEKSVSHLANSLAISVRSRRPLVDEAMVYCVAYRKTSQAGRLKGYDIISVSKTPL
jgi:hypothetical protein